MKLLLLTIISFFSLMGMKQADVKQFAIGIDAQSKEQCETIKDPIVKELKGYLEVDNLLAECLPYFKGKLFGLNIVYVGGIDTPAFESHRKDSILLPMVMTETLNETYHPFVAQDGKLVKQTRSRDILIERTKLVPVSLSSGGCEISIKSQANSLGILESVCGEKREGALVCLETEEKPLLVLCDL